MKMIRNILTCTALLLLVAGSTVLAATNQCIICHLELDDELKAPADLAEADIHNIEGVSCSGCHGGDPAEEDPELAMSAARGFIGVPSIREIPDLCGKCHADPAYMRQYNPSLPTDQLEKYWSSHHGEKQRRGDKKVAQCVSCHGVHDLRPATDPRSKVYAKNVPATCAHCHADAEYMAPYGIATNQYQGYQTSVHAQALLENNDLGAPACNDCHGNHAATPPGVSSIGRVCFQCHLAEGELFNASPHKPAFDDLGMPECAFCHGNHAVHTLTDENIGVTEGAICLECHSEGDPGYQAAASMKSAVVELKERYESAEALIREAEIKGVEVSEELFTLRDVRQSLINSRKLIHSFDPEQVTGSAKEALQVTNQVYDAGLAAMAEVKSRRTGFLVFTVLTLILALLIWLKIR